jgi:hypothetical protein
MLSIQDIKMILADVCRQKCEIVEHNGSVTRLIELLSLELLLHKQLVTMYEAEMNQSLRKVG